MAEAPWSANKPMAPIRIDPTSFILDLVLRRIHLCTIYDLQQPTVQDSPDRATRSYSVKSKD